MIEGIFSNNLEFLAYPLRFLTHSKGYAYPRLGTAGLEVGIKYGTELKVLL